MQHRFLITITSCLIIFFNLIPQSIAGNPAGAVIGILNPLTAKCAGEDCKSGYVAMHHYRQHKQNRANKVLSRSLKRSQSKNYQQCRIGYRKCKIK